MAIYLDTSHSSHSSGWRSCEGQSTTIIVEKTFFFAMASPKIGLGGGGGAVSPFGPEV